jgi:hypothetical protein
MTATLLALAMMAQPQVMTDRAQIHRIAKAIIPVAYQHRLDPTLLAAVVIAETGGRNVVAHKRGRNRAGADVGVFQIHCPKARQACIDRFSDIKRGAAEAAKILSLGRRICQDPPPSYVGICKRGFWARYNPGSAKWAHRVKRVWLRIQEHMARHTGC